ncbi:MAG: hypothetical protein IKC73_04910 [Clostridia bacterium]|nr:hypothetical protein [Clostridia bacterium]
MVRYDKNDAILANIAAAFEKRLRTPCDVTLEIDPTLDALTGVVEDGRIAAGSHSQLMEAAGRFLRNPAVRGSFPSQKPLCGMYFASHFGNYTDEAPLEELYEYIDDLGFWGVNTLKMWLDLHHFRNMGEAREKVARQKKLYAHAKSMGMQIWLTTLSNEAFRDSVRALRADWTCGHDGYVYPLNDHFHVEICPSKPGGMDLIKHYRRSMLEEFRDIDFDFLSIGPYDEGGCSCSACAPWGGNGYLRVVRELIPLYKEYFPSARIILSAWQFGTFLADKKVEFERLAEAIHNDPVFRDVAYLVSEPQYAQYAVTHDMGCPIIGFPEISMFRASPWGGYGANPMPAKILEIYEKYGDKLSGIIPYSEGLYEDINKILVLRAHRDGSPTAKTLREYLAYELRLEGALLERTALAVEAMESTLARKWDKVTHRVEILDPEKIPFIEKEITEIHALLPADVQKSRRWLLLYYRALVDGALLRAGFERSEEVREIYRKIMHLCHLENATGVYQRPDVDDVTITEVYPDGEGSDIEPTPEAQNQN